MFRKYELALVALAIIGCLGFAKTAMAEPTAWDQRIVRLAQENQNAGLVFLEITLFEDGRTEPKICQKIWTYLRSIDGKKFSLFTQVSPTLFGRAADSSTYGGWIVLDEGSYYLTGMWCEGSTTFPGPFAQFTVKRGQILNLGNLVVNYKLGEFRLMQRRRDTGNWRVEDLSPRALASLKKEAPSAFSKAKKQFMIPIRKPASPS